MTDLLTPSDAGGAAMDEPRTFRASTLDEAVAAARAELGPDVELVEAHRVRRGGLGGFFATDLGVEIVAIARPGAHDDRAAELDLIATFGLDPTGEVIEDLVDDGPLGHRSGGRTDTGNDTDEYDVVQAAADVRALLDEAASTIPSIDGSLPLSAPPREVQTALDRLIEHAESVDRVIPVDHADLDLIARDRHVDLPSIDTPARPESAPSAGAGEPLHVDEPHLPAETRLDSFEEYLRAELAAPAPSAPGDLPPSIADSIDATDLLSSAPDPDGSNRAFVGGASLADAVPTLDGLVELGTPGTFVGPGRTDASADTGLAPWDELPVAPVDALLGLPVETVAVWPGPAGHTEPDLVEQFGQCDDVDELGGDDIWFGPSPAQEPDDSADHLTGPTTDLAVAELAPPSPQLNPSLRDPADPVDELDALLQDLGIDVEPIVAAVAPRHDAAGSVRMVAQAAAEQLIEGAAALAQCSGRSVRRLAVSVTAPDGTIVEMSAELAPSPAGGSDALRAAVSDADALGVAPLDLGTAHG